MLLARKTHFFEPAMLPQPPGSCRLLGCRVSGVMDCDIWGVHLSSGESKPRNPLG